MTIDSVWPEWKEDGVMGEGSFAKVYRVKRSELGRTFYSAVKVISVPKSEAEVKHIRSQGLGEDEVRGYFRSIVNNLMDEITLMDNLKGAKNIVGIDDYKIIEHRDDIGWDIFIRMELLTNFETFVSRPGFSQKDVIKLGIDICSALELCEQYKIVHRDIKPDNIFLSRFNDYKLGDFGIARKLEATRANLSRKGTLNYMAPEVYKSEEYGSSVDIYSLGMVLYTLLNDNRIAFLPQYPQPITYKDNEEALTRRLSGETPPPPCNASPSLAATVLKAIAYSPNDRYKHASEFKMALLNERYLLAENGEDREIIAEMVGQANTNDNFINTTNDMTAHGRLVVDEYSQETTVLGNNTAENMTTVLNGVGVENMTTVLNGDPADNMTTVLDDPDSSGYAYAPEQYEEESVSVLSRICKAVSYPLAIITAVLAVILFMQTSGGYSASVTLAALSVALSVGLFGKCKGGVGVSLLSLCMPNVIQSTTAIVNDVASGISVGDVLILLASLLVFFASIVIVTQKEVRLGGSLCIYAAIIDIVYRLYLHYNYESAFDLSVFIIDAALLGTFFWAYGYNKNARVGVVDRVLDAVTYAVAFLSLVVTVYSYFGM